MKILGIVFIVISIIIFRFINPTKSSLHLPAWATANPVANLIVSIIWLVLLVVGIVFLFL